MNDPLIEQLAADLKQESLYAGRAVVLGIDPVPHSLLIKLISSGVMPNMAKLESFLAIGTDGHSGNQLDRPLVEEGRKTLDEFRAITERHTERFLSKRDNIVGRSSGARKKLRALVRLTVPQSPLAYLHGLINTGGLIRVMSPARQFHANPGGIMSPSGA